MRRKTKKLSRANIAALSKDSPAGSILGGLVLTILSITLEEIRDWPGVEYPTSHPMYYEAKKLAKMKLVYCRVKDGHELWFPHLRSRIKF